MSTPDRRFLPMRLALSLAMPEMQATATPEPAMTVLEVWKRCGNAVSYRNLSGQQRSGGAWTFAKAPPETMDAVVRGLGFTWEDVFCLARGAMERGGSG